MQITLQILEPMVLVYAWHSNLLIQSIIFECKEPASAGFFMLTMLIIIASCKRRFSVNSFDTQLIKPLVTRHLY